MQTQRCYQMINYQNQIIQQCPLQQMEMVIDDDDDDDVQNVDGC